MFKYLDPVVIIRGFYKGLEGRLRSTTLDEEGMKGAFYEVEVLGSPPLTVTVREDYIEKRIEKKK